MGKRSVKIGGGENSGLMIVFVLVVVVFVAGSSFSSAFFCIIKAFFFSCLFSADILFLLFLISTTFSEGTNISSIKFEIELNNLSFSLSLGVLLIPFLVAV